MKSFIIGLAMFLLSIGFTVFQHDYHLHQQHTYHLKFTAKEAAAAACQYFIASEYAEGRFVFNRQEGIKAAEYIIKSHLKLDNHFFPQDNSYWREQITYTIQFFDDANTTFPDIYQHEEGNFTLTITDPTVIITIDAGKPRYRLLDNPPNVIRTAAHEWKGR